MPVDHALSPGNTLARARKILIGPQEKWKVLLLGTFRGPFVPASRSVEIHDDLKRKTLDQLTSQRDEIQRSEVGKGLVFELLAYMGSLDNIVQYVSQEQKVDYLLLEADFGSNKEDFGKLLSKAHCPALIIPQH